VNVLNKIIAIVLMVIVDKSATRQEYAMEKTLMTQLFALETENVLMKINANVIMVIMDGTVEPN